jgi:UDP-GlcNAc:undecaprenyl-phosphate GlcNAc-1-phosphate transferase
MPITMLGSTAPIVVSGAAALVSSLALTPLSARLALRSGLVDRPEARKLHTRPVALLGGLAVAAAMAAGVGAGMAAAGGGAPTGPFLLVALGAVVVLGAGLVDDWRSVSVTAKLAAQVAAAGLVVLAGFADRTGLPGVLAVAVTVLWVVGCTNACNLLDNMDGLAGGVGAVAAAAFAVAACAAGHHLAAWLAAALTGALVGFLPFNVHPARVFLGDAGSLLVGYSLAVLALLVQPAGADAGAAVGATVVLAVPLLDTVLVCISRWRRGLNPLRSPGTDHLSHRLVDLGLSVRGAVALLYAAAAAAAVAGLAVAWRFPAVAAAALVVVSCCTIAWLERRSPRGLVRREAR